MYSPFSWIKSFVRIAAAFALAAFIGSFFDNPWMGVAFVAVAVLALQYYQLNRLSRWLWTSKKLNPPKASGIWEHVYDGMYYQQRRQRRKRKEMSSLVKRFREGAEALPDATIVVDVNAIIVWCNRLARIELGLHWPQDSGRRVDNLIRHPKFIEYFHSGDFERPIEIPSPTNIQKIFEFRIMPYGQSHYLIIARDVTLLNQLEQTRKDFVANVSHELRTPLTVLNGYLEMLPSAKDLPPEFYTKAIDEMTLQSARMQSLIEQLLVLSRIEASAERVFEQQVDVPRVLSIIETEAQAINREKNHTITFDVDPALRVYGIETELRSAFSNLIFNAIHYTPNNGQITVRWYLDGDEARFAVQDNGEGIAKIHIGRLTERFYRVDKARSRETGGSGLGLSIVKHVLSHHNSKLEIKSELRKGSEFSFGFSNELTTHANASTDQTNITYGNFTS